MHRLDHATKPFSTNNLFETDRLPFGHRRLVFERPVVSIGVRTRLVVVNNEFANQVIDIILAEIAGLTHVHFGPKSLGLGPESRNRVIHLK